MFSDRPIQDSTSYTALIMAAKRAIEQQRPDRLFDDPFALQLAGEEVDILLAQWATVGRDLDYAKTAFTRFVAIRTRFFDDFLQFASHHAQQIVLLGAGMDTRAYRLPWAAETQIYEIDRPEVLERKDTVLQNVVPSCHRHAIPVDLTDDWAEALSDRGYQGDRPSVWLLEGVLMYPTAEVVHQLLQTITALSLADSYIGADLVNLRSLEAALRSRGRVRRHWQFGTDDPEALFTAYGWNATVVQPGDPTANFGRCPKPPPPRDVPHKRRSFLVTARKI